MRKISRLIVFAAALVLGAAAGAFAGGNQLAVAGVSGAAYAGASKPDTAALGRCVAETTFLGHVIETDCDCNNCKSGDVESEPDTVAAESKGAVVAETNAVVAE